jgi:hypothetical protein
VSRPLSLLNVEVLDLYVQKMIHANTPTMPSVFAVALVFGVVCTTVPLTTEEMVAGATRFQRVGRSSKCRRDP